MKEKKYIVQVAPVTPLPASKMQIFSYLYEEALAQGTLVSIPFFHRRIEGVVISSNEYFSHSGSFKLKKIIKVIEPLFLTEKQINLAKFISSYYLTSLGIVLKSMVPRRVNYRHAEKAALKKKQETKKNGPKALFPGSGKRILTVGSGIKRKEYIFSLIKKAVEAEKQCLILVPEIFYGYSLSEQLKN